MRPAFGVKIDSALVHSITDEIYEIYWGLWRYHSQFIAVNFKLKYFNGHPWVAQHIKECITKGGSRIASTHIFSTWNNSVVLRSGWNGSKLWSTLLRTFKLCSLPDLTLRDIELFQECFAEIRYNLLAVEIGSCFGRWGWRRIDEDRTPS